MKRAPAFGDVLAPISAAASVTEGLRGALRGLVAQTGSTAAALAFRPPQGQAPLVVTGAAGRASLGLRRWLTALTTEPGRGARLTRVVPPRASESQSAALLRSLASVTASSARPVVTMVPKPSAVPDTRRT